MGRRRPARKPTTPREDVIEEHADGDWYVRPITGSSSTKVYRCPGCDHEIVPATPHIVAWPVHAGSDERRHWHSPCWRARDRRGPAR
ncbi:MAG: hypothetical protein ACKOFP_04260 [Actinomycetota bacterium]